VKTFDLDWCRIAEPQPDGYDTDAILSLFERDRPMSYVHTDREADETTSVGPSLVIGTVTVQVGVKALLSPPRFQPAPGNSKVLLEGIDLLNLWPEIATQWPRILTIIQPFNDVNLQSVPPERKTRVSSSSHNDRRRFGVIAITVDDVIGTARGVVHEMAHHKLRAIGVDNEAASRMIQNSRRDLFFSPVVGRNRPMTALLHALYAFVHVLQLDLLLLAQPGSAERLEVLRDLVTRDAPRVVATASTIRQRAVLDDSGAAFVGALLEWTDRLLSQVKNVQRE
jgi:hypothetical protein